MALDTLPSVESRMRAIATTRHCCWVTSRNFLFTSCDKTMFHSNPAFSAQQWSIRLQAFAVYSYLPSGRSGLDAPHPTFETFEGQRVGK